MYKRLSWYKNRPPIPVFQNLCCRFLRFSFRDMLKEMRCACLICLPNRVWHFSTPWTVAPVDRLFCPEDSAGKNTGVGCHFLLQVIFPTQGWNSHLLEPAFQADSLPLSHVGISLSEIPCTWMCGMWNVQGFF